jgi:hypothetical protein
MIENTLLQLENRMELLWISPFQPILQIESTGNTLYINHNYRTNIKDRGLAVF